MYIERALHPNVERLRLQKIININIGQHIDGAVKLTVNVHYLTKAERPKRVVVNDQLIIYVYKKLCWRK
jgi:hypothetical protein